MKECDLVMRGGITSGVVYPRAITELSKTYRFRSVGGTSAGAIAAALTAAAQYNAKAGGFERLGKIPDQISNQLKAFFQPYPELRKVYRRLMGLNSRKNKLGFWPLVRWFTWNFYLFFKLSDKLNKRNFGLCPGTTVHYAKNKHQYPVPGLIDWLNGWIEYVSGRIDRHDAELPGIPLTFGELEANNKSDTDSVTLRMVTTDLSEGVSVTLPISDNGHAASHHHTRQYYLLKSDLDWLVPDNVKQHLISEHSAEDLPDYVMLPKDGDMPVILAVRMSMSFPLLFSAVPVYRKDPTLCEEHCPVQRDQLQRCYFADGGIASNFPIHFFDSLLPTRPTFAINLTEYNKCRHGDDPGSGPLINRVTMPEKTGEGMLLPIDPIGGWLKYAWKIVETARNWQDNVQMTLPGYRERIVSIALKDEQEGGLNLGMKSALVDKLTGLGTLAAHRIVDGLNGDQPFNFEAHRWRRLLALTAAMDEALQKFTSVYKDAPEWDPELLSIREMLERYHDDFDNPKYQEWGYQPAQSDQVKALLDRWDVINNVAEKWSQAALADWQLPHPKPDIRITSSTVGDQISAR
ncbi:MAG: RpoH suppressor SuhR [Wenzhouxiangellaceae bacterium]